MKNIVKIKVLLIIFFIFIQPYYYGIMGGGEVIVPEIKRALIVSYGGQWERMVYWMGMQLRRNWGIDYVDTMGVDGCGIENSFMRWSGGEGYNLDSLMIRLEECYLDWGYDVVVYYILNRNNLYVEYYDSSGWFGGDYIIGYCGRDGIVLSTNGIIVDQLTFIHEMGHWIGMGHCSGEYGCYMGEMIHEQMYKFCDLHNDMYNDKFGKGFTDVGFMDMDIK